MAMAFASMNVMAQYPATSDVLEFQNRKIDVAPFFDAFPYSQFRLSDDGTKLFFLKSGAEARMQWIELDGKIHHLMVWMPLMLTFLSVMAGTLSIMRATNGILAG